MSYRSEYDSWPWNGTRDEAREDARYGRRNHGLDDRYGNDQQRIYAEEYRREERRIEDRRAEERAEEEREERRRDATRHERERYAQAEYDAYMEAQADAERLADEAEGKA